MAEQLRRAPQEGPNTIPTINELVQSGAAEERRDLATGSSSGGATCGTGSCTASQPADGGGGADASVSPDVEVQEPGGGGDCPDGPLASGFNQAVDYVTSGFDQGARPTCPWAWAILLGVGWKILTNIGDGS